MHAAKTINVVTDPSWSLFTVDELASRWRCHRNTIYKMLRDGQLHSFRVRRTHLITQKEVHRVESHGTEVAA